MPAVAAQIIRLTTAQGETHILFSRMAVPQESKYGVARGWIPPEPPRSPHWFHISLLYEAGPWWASIREALPLSDIETAQSFPAAVGLTGYGFTSAPEESSL